MFLGIKCSLEKGHIVILPVAFDQTTTYRKGANKGPAALIEASKHIELYDIETDSEVYKKGIYTAEELQPETSMEMLQITYEAVMDFIRNDKYVVTIGGEHAISYAPIRAHAEEYGPISVLQLDAHTDLDPALNDDIYSHGSVMAQVKTLSNVENVVALGIRSMASKEKKEINPDDVFFAHKLEGDEWMDQVIERLSTNVYLSFDLDVFDSSLMPSTGTPEPGGLFWNQTMQFLRKVIKNRKLIGFDIVELCPVPGLLAPDYLAAKLVYKILSYLFTIEETSRANFSFYEETL